MYGIMVFVLKLLQILKSGKLRVVFLTCRRLSNGKKFQSKRKPKRKPSSQWDDDPPLTSDLELIHKQKYVTFQIDKIIFTLVIFNVYWIFYKRVFHK